MKSRITGNFNDLFDGLPAAIQSIALRAYEMWCQNPQHPGLDFKCVSRRERIYSVRIGIRYRALGRIIGDCIHWYWIGPHAEYDEILKRM